jgi:hypothetical protein
VPIGSADEFVVYKGYCDTMPMSQVLQQSDSLPGNYCIVRFLDTGIDLSTNLHRSFPLWYTDGLITNLPTDIPMTQAWSNNRVTVDSDWNIVVTELHPTLEPLSGKITWEQALDQISQLLDQTTQDFFINNQPDLRVFFSGGVDTLLIYSLLKRNQKSFELINYAHYEQDLFTTQNQQSLNQLWGYRQIHHWTAPSCIATGSHGDEYFLRGPEIIAMLTAWHNLDFANIIGQYPESYHSRYFAKQEHVWQDAWQKRDQWQEQYPTATDLHRQILNFLCNDYQHWHLGNTLTWTPFKNIEIVRILLQVSIEDLLDQFVNATLTKQLIAQSDTRLLSALSRWKNWNSSEHVMRLFELDQLG